MHATCAGCTPSKATLRASMDTLSLFVLTLALGLLLSWVLHRSSDSDAPAGAADEEFFQRIQERLHQNAPGGSEGAFAWTQTNDEVELVMPLEPHVKAKDVEFRILPATVRLGIRGAAQPLLEVRLCSFHPFRPRSLSLISNSPAGRASCIERYRATSATGV